MGQLLCYPAFWKEMVDKAISLNYTFVNRLFVSKMHKTVEGHLTAPFAERSKRIMEVKTI